MIVKKLKEDFKPSSEIASKRISLAFMNILENQFPIENKFHSLQLKTPFDFAGQLNIHVNHLNRVLKSNFNKTTTSIISERILHEAKYLLLESSWNISEIAYALGFKEVTHFNNFFKKHSSMSPSKYRNEINRK